MGHLDDTFIDAWLHVLSGPDLKVYLYLWRRTEGFGKAEDAVSVRQISAGIVTKAGKRLDHGTGLKRRTVFAALQHLELLGLVERSSQKGKATRYRLPVQPSARVDGEPVHQGARGGAPGCTPTCAPGCTNNLKEQPYSFQPKEPVQGNARVARPDRQLDEATAALIERYGL